MVDYQRTFGVPDADDTGVSAQLFFQNGGKDAYVVRTDDVESTGLQALASVDLFNLLSIPGTALMTEADAAETVMAVASFCAERRAFYLVDPPGSLSPADVTSWKDELQATTNGALYFPGVRIDDPLSPGQPRDVPASGAVAGVIARVDIQRGFWVAPAGIGADIRAAQGATVTLTESDGERLIAAGICPLRSFPGQGIRVWGARTLASADAPEWKYISVRRLFLFLEESIERGTRWAAFEPNDEPLWRSIRSSVESFLLDLFQKGALAGRRPEDAYFVRCDRMTMTQDDIDNGRLICLVGVAPVRPAEFVTVRHAWSLVPPSS